MECPFELPVIKKKYEDPRVSEGPEPFFIVSSDTKLRLIRCDEQCVDYIVQAINSHEKLVNACGKAKGLYDELSLSTLGAACKYGDNYQPPTKEDCLKIRELLEQALEAEKT